MHQIILHLALFVFAALILEVVSQSMSDIYVLKFSNDMKSNKDNMAVLMAPSKMQCAIFCQRLLGCGGYNVLELDLGLYQCEFKHGLSMNNDTEAALNVTYYENSVPDLSIISGDCADLQNAGVTVSGVYDINLTPDGTSPTIRQVYCDMDTDGGGWTTLMKREDGSVDFNRTWSDYRDGFGNLSGEHWLGLENMYVLLNNSRRYKLRVDLRLFTGETGYAQYDTFLLEPETNAYKIYVSGHSGTANDSLSHQNNMSFCTADVDNDFASYSCGSLTAGGFWFDACGDARLTGLYGEQLPPLIYQNRINFVQGILWYPWLNLTTHPQYADMKIKV